METIEREKDGGFVACACADEARWSAAIARATTESEAIARARTESSDARRLGAVSVTLLKARTPSPGESYEEYIASHGLLGGGIGYVELVRPRDPRHLLPLMSLWPKMIPALAAAHWLRSEVINAGGHGLVIHAAHRVAGGAAKSKHIVNAALDLDLLQRDYDAGLGEQWLEAAARFYKRHGHLKIGIGSYHPKGTRSTRRVHVDAGVRWWDRTVWQYSGDTKLKNPAIAALAKAMR